MFDWAKSNGRIRGMKAHVVYDPGRDLPQILDITDANVNDAQIGREIEIEPGLTYVFDKGYCHYGWWTAIAAAGAFFVTRPKSNMGLTVETERQYGPSRGQGFTVIADEEVVFSSKGDSKLPVRLRRIEVVRDEDKKMVVVISNDMKRSAVEIAQAYKFRWQIELLFRWLKQHLKIRKFLGTSPNAVKLQIYAAMIAYILLRLAAKAVRTKFDILRFTELVGLFLFALAASPRSTSRLRSIPASNATEPIPINWRSTMCEISPDSRAPAGRRGNRMPCSALTATPSLVRRGSGSPRSHARCRRRRAGSAR